MTLRCATPRVRSSLTSLLLAAVFALSGCDGDSTAATDGDGADDATGTGGGASGGAGDGSTGAIGGTGDEPIGTGGAAAGGTSSGGALASGGSSWGQGGEDGGGETGGSAPEPTLFESVLPFQEWDGPGATVTGVLFVAAGDSYGPTWDWGRGLASTEGSAGDVYRFSHDRSSAYALYFESAGEGENYLEDWSVPLADGTEATYDAAMMTPALAGAWGLSAEAHLVTLSVNDGRGSNSGVHFVVTEVTVLDGTDDYPIDVTATLSAGRAAFDAQVASLSDDLDELLDQLVAASSPPEGAGVTVDAVTGLFPTWDSESATLEETWVHRRTASYSVELDPQPYDCPDGAPCMPPQQLSEIHRFEVTVVGLRRVSADGVADDLTILGPEGATAPVETTPGGW